MGLGSSKVAIVLICFGVLALLAHNASATRRMGPRPRLEREQSTFHDGLPNLTRNLSITEHLQEQTAAPAPSTAFDPSQANKRGIPGGSDPIHNRYGHS
ncbi:hypothetical protein ACJRO7_009675 [Eucalyptus globulus]|uniref:Uncharacterized protein n=1 Tax=Eucalyptus globulus TaxID=34317 RepID=A0ABD3LJG8_EUCGL